MNHLTLNINVTYKQTTSYAVASRSIGDIILPNICALLPYFKFASKELGSHYYNIAIILGVNLNFNLDLRDFAAVFLQDKFNLRLIANRQTPIIQFKTYIDAVFSRHIDTLEYITYFS